MKITNINIDAFGKFIGKSMSFSDGINIVNGNNEAGKTTTHTFIKCMLFGIKKRKGKSAIDIYKKYYPWDSKNSYGGSLSFIYEGKEYQITREFNEKNPLFEIREITNNGTLVEEPEMFLNKVLHNLNVDTFDNTISIGQLKSAQDQSMVEELHRIIANLNTSGDMSIDSLSAIKYLTLKKEKLLLSIDSDATLVYNRQLGNIRNLERELSNKEYYNKISDIMTKKSQEKMRIDENNELIENLKKENIKNSLTLSNIGFTERADIDSTLSEVNKVYLEYKPIMNDKKIKKSIFLNVVTTFIGIIFIAISALILIASYPDISKFLNISDTRYSMNAITNFLINLPFHPIILISIYLCIGIILILWSVILFTNNIQNKNKSKNLENILSDVFLEHINDDNVNSENMIAFKKHISNMRRISKKIDDNELKIIALTEENNELLKKQTEYDETIKSQQRIQFDVEQKYTELYNLKVENEKMKHLLDTNEQINKEIESINLAIETIKNLADEIKIAFGTHLNNSISRYISIFTNGKYSSLNVDNALNVTINYDGKVIPLSKVSTGTIDQTYLALRLAITDIINGTNDKLPLIFDDCFAMYDNSRLESVLKYLSTNINTQIIIFTCHTREKALLRHNESDIKSFDI